MDEDTGRPRPEDDSDGLGFSLPPISLPEVQFPDRIRLVLPIPEPPERVSKPTKVRVAHLLVVVGLVDALDALAVVVVGPTALPWVRATLGTALAVVFVGGPGVLYLWELLAILGGFGGVALTPTATILLLVESSFLE